ncbi:MAG: type II toxin-antitoxin system VapC family toxin [Verrucomicrobiota bacterium JB025]|nr:PIN domain-containing protein [Verrucomicrobiota bacterium JB025]
MKQVLVDTNVWVKHFRDSNDRLERIVEAGEVLTHPIVVGELSMGCLVNRMETLWCLSRLGRPPLASDAEVMQMVEARKLWGRGIQWGDAHLLASAIIGDVELWTHDGRLREIAVELGVSRAEC